MIPRAFEGRHALVGNRVFTVVNGDFNVFHQVPRREDSPGPSSLFLDDIWNIGWISNQTPFMSFVPARKSFFCCPLFHQLHFDNKPLPLKQLPNRNWSLDLDLVQEWVALERNLRAALHAMLDCCRAPLPRFFQLWSFPKRYGYELAYRTRRQAQFVALRSRDAFVPLMAALSFAILGLHWSEVQVDVVSWRERVLKKTGIHHQWITELEMSPLGDFLDIPRVGGIIDIATCEFRWMLPQLRQANMPLYYYWGTIDNLPLRLPDFLQELFPGRTEIERLRTIAQHQLNPPPSALQTDIPCHLTRSSSVPPPSNDSTPSITNGASPASVRPRTFPPVEKYSGQLEGEDWRTFFARRENADAERAKVESPQARQSRMQREENAAKGFIPGKKGATVFFWDEVDGFLVRRAAGRKHYEGYWYDFAPSQRKYNSFRDEWDLCREFAPTDEPDDSEYDDDDNDDDFQSLPLLPDNPEQPPNLIEGASSSCADLRRIHDMQDMDDSNARVEFNDTLDDLVYYRFGFVNPLYPVREPLKTMDWPLARKLVGVSWDRNCAEPSKGVQESICIFFGYLLSEPRQIMPKPIHDLQQPDADVNVRSKIRISRKLLGDKIHYFISPKSTVDEPSLQLVLTNSASVFEIVRRQWGPDLVEIARQLLNRGISFNTCIRGIPRQPLPLKLIPRYPGLGYRPEGHKPDILDYTAYESYRHRILTSSRGRAAVLAGGIVARLARDIVRHEDVCYGPSDSVFEDGLCLWDSRSSSAYWDDQLTDDEVDVICGVYRVDTGQKDAKNGGRQTTDISWWPKPSAWEVSGLNVGYWSRDCESWFQNRLADIKSGTADLRSPGKWRHSLKFTRSSCQLAAHNNERLAAQFLNQ